MHLEKHFSIINFIKRPQLNLEAFVANEKTGHCQQENKSRKKQNHKKILRPSSNLRRIKKKYERIHYSTGCDAFECSTPLIL